MGLERVRFGVRRRPRGPPFALGHQFIILVAIQGEGEGESGYTSRVGYFHVSVRFKKKTMVGKGALLMRKETTESLGRIEVGGEENSKWMGRQTKKSVDRFQTEYQGLWEGICQGILNFLLGYRG